MEKKNSVFIACSIDGFIADRDGGIDWLHSVPNPDNIDMGYEKFSSGIDALVMGRKTFDTVDGFDIDWPYKKYVFVLSNSIKAIPEKYRGKVSLVSGALNQILGEIHAKGYHRLYIDGGSTIQNFLREDLIDEMIITTIPILLGGGAPLFSSLPKEILFQCYKSEILLDTIVQSSFRRIKT